MTRQEFIKKFKIGYKLKLDTWKPEDYAEITKINKSNFFFVSNNGFKNSGSFAYDWKLYTK